MPISSSSSSLSSHSSSLSSSSESSSKSSSSSSRSSSISSKSSWSSSDSSSKSSSSSRSSSRSSQSSMSIPNPVVTDYNFDGSSATGTMSTYANFNDENSNPVYPTDVFNCDKEITLLFYEYDQPEHAEVCFNSVEILLTNNTGSDMDDCSVTFDIQGNDTSITPSGVRNNITTINGISIPANGSTPVSIEDKMIGHTNAVTVNLGISLDPSLINPVPSPSDLTWTIQNINLEFIKPTIVVTAPSVATEGSAVQAYFALSGGHNLSDINATITIRGPRERDITYDGSNFSKSTSGGYSYMTKNITIPNAQATYNSPNIIVANDNLVSCTQGNEIKLEITSDGYNSQWHRLRIPPTTYIPLNIKDLFSLKMGIATNETSWEIKNDLEIKASTLTRVLFSIPTVADAGRDYEGILSTDNFSTSIGKIEVWADPNKRKLLINNFSGNTSFKFNRNNLSPSANGWGEVWVETYSLSGPTGGGIVTKLSWDFIDKGPQPSVYVKKDVIFDVK